VDARLKVNDREFRIVDTAGMKRVAKKISDVDFYSVRRAQDSLDRADVALLMLDVQDGVTATDAAIAGRIQQSRKAYVVLANKWDLTSDDTRKHREEFAKHIEKKLHFLQDAPVVFTSGLDDKGIDEIFEWAAIAHDNWGKRLSTGQLNASLEKYIQHRPPPAYRGKRLNFFYATQPKIKPPTIVAFVNSPSSVRQSYIRYLQKQLRAEHDFRGTPVEMFFKRRTKKSRT